MGYQQIVKRSALASGIMLLSLSCSVCGRHTDPDIPEPSMHYALVFGELQSTTQPISNRAILARAFNPDCAGVASSEVTTTDASGAYRVLAGVQGGDQDVGLRCVVVSVVPLSGSDSLSDTVLVRFRRSVPLDSIRVDLELP